MPPEQRADSARKAAQARWSNRSTITTPGDSDRASGERPAL